MGAILIITVFLVFVASFALLRTKRDSSTEDAHELPPGVSPRGLFGEEPRAEPPAETPEQARRRELLDRAGRGDLAALAEAHAAGDDALYRAVLDELVTRCRSDAGCLRRLAARVARGEGLRSSPELAELTLGEWRRDPTRQATAEMLRVSALSGDAGTFGRAVDEVLGLWEEGRLPGLGAAELRSLFEGEYWLLSSEAKRSGAGFVLKQKLADARRQLAARPRGGQTTTEGGRPAEAPAQKERP